MTLLVPRLEVHLEMGSEGGEETSSLAVSETNTLDHDNASTKALAGSIARYKVKQQSGCDSSAWSTA